jgi:CoA:oxalate CoA-transferase
MSNHDTSTAAAPLAGLKVLDLTTFLSGPFCTQILADLGADVTKVEPVTGDSSRAIPPHFVGEDSVYFLANNRGKSSIAVDMKSPDGLRLVERLIAVSDVVVENFRPGVCLRLGLDVEAITAKHPQLIWASISGFGQTGDNAERPAYDMVVQALAGVMSLTGESGGSPVRLGIPAGDLVAGLYAVIGILAALPHQKLEGVGRVLDISMLDGQLSMLSYQAAYAMHSGVVPAPQGSGHDSIPTYRSYVGSDGRMFVVTANTERMWRNLCHTVARPELLSDPRFANSSSRLTHRADLDAVLESAFTERTAAEWVEQLLINDVPVAPIRNVLEALDDAKQTDRGMILELQSSTGQRFSSLGNPVRYVGAPMASQTYPPRLGEQSRQTLERIGLDDAEIDRLIAEGIVVSSDESADCRPEWRNTVPATAQ